MFSKKLSIVLIAALILGLLPNSWMTERVHAATTGTVSLDAQADLMYDSDAGVLDNDLAGRFYAGRDLDSGTHYISRGALRFNLDSGGALPGVPIKYELQIHVIAEEVGAGDTFYLDVWGSDNNNMLDSDGTFPTWSTSTSVRKTDAEITSGQKVTFDVTSLVAEQSNAGDRNVTFVITGNETANDSRIIGGLKEEPNPSYRPQLIITYKINEPPTGSIAINGGASHANSTNVTLNLTGVDPDANPLEMNFSNDNSTWSGWETFSATKSWTLPSGDGSKTVYYQLRDPSLATSPVYNDTITIDTVAPVVTGVTAGGLYKIDKSITFNEGTATLDGSAFTSGTTVTSETPSPHVLVVTDTAGNITTVTFTIDKTNPVVTGVTNGGLYKVDKTITFNEGTATLDGSAFTSGSTVTTETPDPHVLVVTDAVGNSTTVNFTIDKTAPTVAGVSDGLSYNTDRTITFSGGTATLDGSAFTSGTTVTSETPSPHVLVVTDTAGNITTVTFTIDKTNPVVTGVTNNGLYKVDKTISFDEGTATLDGSAFTSGSTVTTETPDPHVLVVTDAAGNSTTVNFTIDKTAPTVSGVSNGISYNTDRTVTFSEGTATLNGASFTTGTTITADGVYALNVTDAAGNSTAVAFTIDKANPIVTGVADGGAYKDDKTITFDEGTATLDGSAFTSGSTVSAETPNPHVLVVTDAAGNTTTVNFTIDKTTPTVSGVSNGINYNSDRTVTFSEGTAILNGASFATGTTITADGAYTLIVTDTAGNITTVTFTIDKTNPVVTGVTNGGAYKVDKTITFDEGTATLDGSAFASGSTVSAETPNPHVLVVTDATGNSTTVSFTIDKTAPTVSGASDGGNYNVDKIITFSEGTATLNGASFTAGTTISSDGAYTLIVTDTAGNSTTVAFTIDKTNPVVTGVINGGVYKADKTITFDEGTATLDGSAFASGSTVSSEAPNPHVLVVTDATGNSTTVSFTIDKTAPTVTGVSDGGNYNVDKIITFNDGTATLNGTSFASGATISAEGAYTLIVADSAGNSTTVAFAIDKTNPVVTGVADGENYTTSKTVTYNEGTAKLNGSSFTSGTTIGTSGTYTLIVTDASGNSTNVAFTIAIPSPGPGPGSGNTDDQIDIIINGVVQEQVATAAIETVDGSKVTTITVDEDKLTEALDGERNRPAIIIPVNNGSDEVISELNGRTVQTLDNKNASIQIQTDNASYTISANQFNMNKVKKDFGSDVPLQDITVSVQIKKVPDEEVEFIRNHAGKITLVAPPVEFTVTATHGDQTVEINKFLSFVQRTIAIPDGVDPKKITTGVVIAENGKAIPVPTRIVQQDGKYYAVIYSLTNSIYTVIYNEKTFADISNHWAKTYIEDMAARLIIEGVTEKQFQPNGEVTRAEFTAILVRALGLHTVDQPVAFKDVHNKDWFYEAVSIAVSHGLIEGNGDNTFKPNQKLTREEAMVILYKAMKLANMDINISEEEVNDKLSEFKDSGKINSTSRTAAALNIKFGIIQGSNGFILPTGILTRAEAAKIIQNFLQQAKLI